MFEMSLSNDRITLFDAFHAGALVLLSIPTFYLCLRNLKKSVIPYRIGDKPSNHAGFSQYTLFSKTYLNYVFTLYATCLSGNTGTTTILNTEV